MRPHPPELIFDLEGPNFGPAPDVSEWINETFVDEGSEIENPDHAHLQHATIGVLWTSVANARQGRSVIGQAEEGSPRAMGRWAKARAEQQVVEWFMADLLAISVRKSVTEPLADMLFGGEGGGSGKAGTFSNIVKSFLGSFGRRAAGGPVSAGTPYVVGENRAELFIPSVPGMILPSIDGASGGMSAGGGVNITFAPVFDARGAGPREVDTLRAEMARMQQTLPGTIVKTVAEARQRRAL